MSSEIKGRYDPNADTVEIPATQHEAKASFVGDGLKTDGAQEANNPREPEPLSDDVVIMSAEPVRRVIAELERRGWYIKDKRQPSAEEVQIVWDFVNGRGDVKKDVSVAPFRPVKDEPYDTEITERPRPVEPPPRNGLRKFFDRLLRRGK